MISGRRASRLVDDPVELVIGIGEAGEIALLHDGGGEARLGKDHHAGGRLQQMGAGARADDEEEGVLHLAVQPDDAGQAAEHFALAAFAQHSVGNLGRDVAAGGGERAAWSCGDRSAIGFGRRLESRHAQLPDELAGVDDVGEIGGKREPHQLLAGQPDCRTARTR